MGGTEFFEKEVKKRNFISKKIKDTRINFQVETKITEKKKSKNFRVKTSRYYSKYTWYREGKDRFNSKGKVDFYVFFFEKNEKAHYIIIPRKDLAEKIKFKELYSRRAYHFYFQLQENGKVFDVRERERDRAVTDYSKYLDKKGWDLVEEVLA